MACIKTTASLVDEPNPKVHEVNPAETEVGVKNFDRGAAGSLVGQLRNSLLGATDSDEESSGSSIGNDNKDTGSGKEDARADAEDIADEQICDARLAKMRGKKRLL